MFTLKFSNLFSHVVIFYRDMRLMEHCDVLEFFYHKFNHFFTP